VIAEANGTAVPIDGLVFDCQTAHVISTNKQTATIQRAGSGILERVAMRWNRQAVPSHRVNPLYII
jgi:hypothetical protein